MPPDARSYRAVLSRFATGVTVVTAPSPGGHGCGLTVNAFTSVSLDPLLLLVCLSVRSESYEAIVRGQAFAVNVLAEGDRELALRFSAERRAVRFRGVDVRTEATGSPVLNRALAWIDCTVHAVHRAGDHALILGEPVALGASDDDDPLVFYRSAYRKLAP
jgi:flavin reductase (DIM6/NTAB) family NADH-FMN oxidoreductase RutF